MKYIIGTTFNVKSKRFQIKGPLTSTAAKSLSKNKNKNMLNEGNYNLRHIKKTDTKLHYIFTYNDIETIVLEFNTSKEADKLIGSYLGR